jgi:hypothetical protein
MDERDGFPADDFAAIAKVLATGYWCYRQRIHQQNSLDVATEPSVHGHEVNEPEKGERVGNSGPAAA